MSIIFFHLSRNVNELEALSLDKMLHARHHTDGGIVFRLSKFCDRMIIIKKHDAILIFICIFRFRDQLEFPAWYERIYFKWKRCNLWTTGQCRPYVNVKPAFQ